MEFERRDVARTTISKDALLFFDAQRGVLTAAFRTPRIPEPESNSTPSMHCR